MFFCDPKLEHILTYHKKSQTNTAIFAILIVVLIIAATAMEYFWYYTCIMMIAKRAQEEEESWPYQRRHSRYQKHFHRALSHKDQQLRQWRIPCVWLQEIEQSPWPCLFYSYNDQALITLTGLDHATFDYLLRLFQPIFDNYTPFGDGDNIQKKLTKGRKRTVDALDVLVLVLTWMRT